MPVVGTAGHVDHGKSTLVQALTGRDPDRWREEKERGLTIDLGFAWATLPGGIEVSFVDVPGHEKFIKNMLAGVEGIDVALLVVATDEGWMPQSEEHAAVLDLLEIDRGVVALTKVDRVDEDLVELATLEIEERLAGLSLAGSVIVPVSAPTGAGIDRLADLLAEKVTALPPPRFDRPRLWIDRSFTISGAGTVVTGTLLDGTLAVGDQVTLWPGGRTVRIRGLHSHERAVDQVGPRRRVAVNLIGVERDEVPRGAMLGLGDQWDTTDRLLVTLRPARYVDELSDRGAYHLHVGSGAHPVRIRLLDRTSGGFAALVDLPGPLPLRTGDRFVLREVGRRSVVAGGRVLDPDPPRRGTRAREAARILATAGDDPHRLADALLAVRGIDSAARLAKHTGGGVPPVDSHFGDTAVSTQRLESLRRELLEKVDDHHRRHPLRPGISTGELAGALGLDPGLTSELVRRFDELSEDAGIIARAGFHVSLSAAEEERWEEAAARLREGGRTPPRLSDLGLDTELVHALERRGSLVRISDDLVYLPDQLEELMAVIRSMDGPFTVSEFREAASVSRKFAVPLLEWADRQGITVRIGDRRRLR